MLPVHRLALALAAIAALAFATTPAAAGCKLAHSHACARPGASCGWGGRRGVCETTHPLRHPHQSGCVCAIPISHGGGGHRK
jgi:hypothetical protein